MTGIVGIRPLGITDMMTINPRVVEISYQKLEMMIIGITFHANTNSGWRYFNLNQSPAFNKRTESLNAEPWSEKP